MANIIQKYKRNAGLCMVYTGLALLMMNGFFIKNSSNILMICSLILIVSGIAVHIAILKKDSKY